MPKNDKTLSIETIMIKDVERFRRVIEEREVAIFVNNIGMIEPYFRTKGAKKMSFCEMEEEMIESMIDINIKLSTKI